MRRAFGLASAAVLLLAASATGCEAVTSRDGLQCRTTADCEARGSDFDGTVCSAGVCEKIVVPSGTTSTAGCVTSEDCLFSLGGAGRCVANQCVALTPQSTVTSAALCQTFGPVADDSAVLFGALLPFGSSLAANAASGIGTAQSIDNGTLLNDALSVWNQVAASATPPAPQMSVVACDEADLDASLKLFAAVDVPFVLGPYTGNALKSVLASTLTAPLFSPLGETAALEQLGGAHYFCSANLSDTAPSFRNAIDVVARSVAKARGKTTVKVALVEDSAEPQEAELASDVQAAGFTFNGETPSASNFVVVDVNNGTAATKIDVEASSTGAGVAQSSQLAIFQPDVVVLTGPLWTPTLLDELEIRWAGLNPGLTPPTYLAMHTSIALATFAQQGSTASLAGRVFAFDVARSAEETSNYQALEVELSSRGIAHAYGIGQFEDCLFTAMYAVAAPVLGQGASALTLTPAQVSSGVAQVTHTVTTSSGRGDIAADATTIGDVFTLLTNKQTTELVGSSAYLGLDPTSNVPTFSAPSVGSISDPGHSFGILCPTVAPASADWVSAGVNYDKSAPGVPAEGSSLACPTK